MAEERIKVIVRRTPTYIAKFVSLSVKPTSFAHEQEFTVAYTIRNEGTGVLDAFDVGAATIDGRPLRKVGDGSTRYIKINPGETKSGSFVRKLMHDHPTADLSLGSHSLEVLLFVTPEGEDEPIDVSTDERKLPITLVAPETVRVTATSPISVYFAAGGDAPLLIPCTRSIGILGETSTLSTGMAEDDILEYYHVDFTEEKVYKTVRKGYEITATWNLGKGTIHFDVKAVAPEYKKLTMTTNSPIRLLYCEKTPEPTMPWECWRIPTTMNYPLGVDISIALDVDGKCRLVEVPGFKTGRRDKNFDVTITDTTCGAPTGRYVGTVTVDIDAGALNVNVTKSPRPDVNITIDSPIPLFYRDENDVYPLPVEKSCLFDLGYAICDARYKKNECWEGWPEECVIYEDYITDYKGVVNKTINTKGYRGTVRIDFTTIPYTMHVVITDYPTIRPKPGKTVKWAYSDGTPFPDSRYGNGQKIVSPCNWPDIIGTQSANYLVLLTDVTTGSPVPSGFVANLLRDGVKIGTLRVGGAPSQWEYYNIREDHHLSFAEYCAFVKAHGYPPSYDRHKYKVTWDAQLEYAAGETSEYILDIGWFAEDAGQITSIEEECKKLKTTCTITIPTPGYEIYLGDTWGKVGALMGATPVTFKLTEKVSKYITVKKAGAVVGKLGQEIRIFFNASRNWWDFDELEDPDIYKPAILTATGITLEMVEMPPKPVTITPSELRWTNGTYRAAFRIGNLTRTTRYRVALLDAEDNEIEANSVTGVSSSNIRADILKSDLDEYGYKLSCSVHNSDTGVLEKHEDWVVPPYTIKGNVDIPKSSIPTTIYLEESAVFDMMVENTGDREKEYAVVLTFKNVDSGEEFEFTPDNTIRVPARGRGANRIAVVMPSESVPAEKETQSFDLIYKLQAF